VDETSFNRGWLAQKKSNMESLEKKLIALFDTVSGHL
jgi:hypothetical protein